MLGQPFGRAHPAVAIARLAVLEGEGVQHAVPDEPMRAGRFELRVWPVAVETAVELAGQFAAHGQRIGVAFHRNRPEVSGKFAIVGLRHEIASRILTSSRFVIAIALGAVNDYLYAVKKD